MDCHNKKVQLTIRPALVLPLILAISGTLMAQQCAQNPSSQSVPCGFVDSPKYPDLNGLQGAINVTGWTLSKFGGISVTVYRNPLLGEATQPNGFVLIGGAPVIAHARPDIAASYPSYPDNDFGWGMQILTNLLPPTTNGGSYGNGTYTLHIIASDAEGVSTDFQVTINTDNAHATKPFGTIDTPAQSQGQQNVVSGFNYVNFGWALTPQPYMIPIDGSTINLVLDSVILPTHPVYNNYRSDIANTFPGYANSGGAVGYIYLNTTSLENKVHTISWNVYDNAARGEGIGSRYFSVNNTAQPMDWNTFVSCVETYTTTYTVCQLNSSNTPYPVTATLVARGSNKVISGTVVSSRAETTLQRANANVYNMILLDEGTQNITIQDMTIDGNRQFVGSTYPTITYSPYSYVDINLSLATSNVSVVDVDFIKSPGFGLLPAQTYTAINYCNFTGGFLSGIITQSYNSNLTLYQNHFTNYGGSGLALAGGSTISVTANTFDSNVQEFPDRTACSGAPCPAGQVFEDKTVNGVIYLENMFYGGNVNGCSIGNCGLYSNGIEGYGTNVTITGNTFQNHKGSGIYYAGVKYLTIQPTLSRPGTVSQGSGNDGIQIWNLPNQGFGCAHDISITGATATGNARYGLEITANGDGSITNVTLGTNTFQSTRLMLYSNPNCS